MDNDWIARYFITKKLLQIDTTHNLASDDIIIDEWLKNSDMVKVLRNGKLILTALGKQELYGLHGES